MAATAIFGVAIYQAVPSLTGVAIVGALGIIAIWLGFKIFRLTLKYGANQIFTGLYLSPDIDKFVEKLDKEDESKEGLS